MKHFLTSLACLALMLLFAAGGAHAQKPLYAKKYPDIIRVQPDLQNGPTERILGHYLTLSPGEELSLVQQWDDALGFQHEKYQLFYQQVPVEGVTLTLHKRNGKVETISTNMVHVAGTPVQPAIGKQQALENALAHVAAEQWMWQQDESYLPKGELVILPDYARKAPPRLAWKFDIYATQPLYRAWVFVDAQTGEVVFENPRIHHANVPATGTSLYNGNVSFTADYTGTIYRLRQTSSGNGVETYNLNNGTNYSQATDFTSSTSNFTADPVGVQAHWGAEQVHAYFLQKHNRNSYDGNGSKLLSYVHYSTNYVNAFWDGTRMTYGDGDGTNYGPLVALDICGHEITHGVTEYSANLVYQNESGALNESFSDIFGECVENFGTGTNDWLVGDEIGIGGSGGALRSMSNPNAYSDPDTYGGTYWYTGTADNGGVHINSGVQNKWFYILAVGESGTNDLGNSYSVTGLGIDKAAAIAYRNLTVYLTSSSDYAAARAGAIQAAIDLYGAGSPEEIATTDAWYAVGVGGPYQPPIGCVADPVVLNITLDNYPSETTWDLKDASGTVIASGGPYSTQGGTVTQTFNLANGDYTFTIYDSYGDGICCGYGNGSYALTSGSVTIVQGGAFGSSESTNFCVDTGSGGTDTTPPSTPGNLTASNITTSSVDLSWTASTDNVGVTGYNVYVNGTLVGNTTATSYTVSGLSASTTYNMSVTAYDAAGNESSPASISVTTATPPDTTPPSTPGNLTASNVTTSSVDLSWTASTDNVGVAGYNIYVDGSAVGNTTATSFTVSGLSANTTYNMSVTAYDAAGNESSPASISVTTQSGGGSNCVGASVTLTLTLDNYPGETTWDLKNSAGTVVASGGPYSTAGATVTRNFNLAADSYTFTIYDSYGDGICCAYGNGSYTLTSGGTTIASGGSFGSSESTNFCVDAGGGGGGGNTTTILAHYFETGWDGWIDGGVDCYRYSGSRSYEGSYSIRLRDNSGVASSMTSAVYDVSSFNQLDIQFYFYPYSMETGEDFWVRFYDGSTWRTVAAYVSGTHFNNNNFYVATVTLSSADYNFPTNARFRFQCDASSNYDHVYIDAVTITGTSGTALMAGKSSQSIQVLPAPQQPELPPVTTGTASGASKFAAWPNPVSGSELHLRVPTRMTDLQITDLAGRTVRYIGTLEAGRQTIQLDRLEAGVYLLTGRTETGARLTLKLVRTE